MATCLITVGGTYGEVLFNYLDSGSVAHSIVSGPGEFYLDDDGSDYTYSVLYGDVTASSSCIALDESPFTCYLIYWIDSSSFTLLNNFTIQSIISGNNEYSLYEKLYNNGGSFTITIRSLANAINDLGYPTITAPSINSSSNNIIIRTDGGNIPYLKLANKNTFYNIYLKGTEVMDCVPAGYTEMNIWPVIPATTTTTSTTTTTTTAAPAP